MSIEILKEENTSREMKVAVEAALFQKACKQELKKISQTTRMNGFRKGKVPFSVVQKRYGQMVNQQITEKMINDSLSEHLNGVEEILVSQPSVTDYKLSDDGGFVYNVSYQFVPQFELNNYTGRDISIEMHTVTDEYFENYLNEKVLTGFAKREAVTGRDVVEAGDLAIVDMEAYRGDEKIESFTKTDLPLEIGKQAFSEALDQAVTGTKVGDVVESDYTAPEADAEAVTLKVTVKGIEQFIVPELTDELVKENFAYGREDYTIDNFKEDLKKQLEGQITSENNNKMIETYLEELAAEHDFEVPVAVKESSKQSFHQRHMQQNQGDTIKPEDLYATKKDEIDKMARVQVLLLKLKKVAQIQASEDEVIKQLFQMRQMYGLNQEQIEQIMGNREQYNEILNMVEQRKLESFIVDNNNMKSSDSVNAVTE